MKKFNFRYTDVYIKITDFFWGLIVPRFGEVKIPFTDPNWKGPITKRGKVALFIIQLLIYILTYVIAINLLGKNKG